MNQSMYLPQPVCKDRRGWLIAFGVVEILIACFLAMMAALIVFAVTSLPRTPQQPPMPARSMVPAIGFYLVLAAGFIAVGIGSIRAREWARIAMIVVSSLWMAFGLLGILFVAVLMPAIFRQQQQSMPQQMPEGFQTTLLIIVIAIQAIFMVVVPLVFLLFYCSKSVKATCQGLSIARTFPPAVPGTVPGIAPALPAKSRLPVPVVILIVWFLFSALSTVSIGFWMPVTTFFGLFFRGVSAQIFFAVFALVYAYCAWGFYKLRSEGWWIAVVSSAFWFVSGVVSMIVLGPSRIVEETYKYIKIDPEQAALFSHNPQMMVIGFVFGLLLSAALMALIIYCKPYFSARASARADNP